MLKTHFAVKPPMDASETAACGRGRDLHMTSDVMGVSCGHCKNKDSYVLALDEAKTKQHEAFMAQTPREVREPWQQGHIVCRNCGERKFREGNRTCYGHYQNFHCSACGHVESRLTETGMSF